MTKTYVDSGIIFQAWRHEDPAERAKARQLLADFAQRSYIFSDYTILEVIPKATLYKNRDELAFYETLLEGAARIVREHEIVFGDVLELACKHGLGAIDAMHAQAAIVSGADELVTTERKGRALFSVPSFQTVSLR